MPSGEANALIGNFVNHAGVKKNVPSLVDTNAKSMVAQTRASGKEEALTDIKYVTNATVASERKH